MTRNDATYDPVDYERACIRDHALDLARFAEIVATLVDMRKDDRAHNIFGAAMEEMAELKKHFTELGRKLHEQANPDVDAMRQRANLAMQDAERRRTEADAGASS